MSCENVRKVAELSRESLLKSIGKSSSTELDEALMEATLKEVQKGFLVGPISPQDMPEGSLLTKRFPVQQKNKVRPIDDYKANMVNQSVIQTEGVTVHTLDHISSMTACWLRKCEGKKSRRRLVAKYWVSDAYKQIPLSDSAYDMDSFLAVYDPGTGRPSVFQQKVLPFGSIASVTAFLRVSNALWAIGSKLLKLAWSAYFDDFLSLSEKDTEKHTEMCILSLFSLFFIEGEADPFRFGLQSVRSQV